MRILELFSGTKSVSKVFAAAGWEVLTVDNDPTSAPEICMDAMQLTCLDILSRMGGPPDVIWASPPCTCFSVASIGRHWTGGTRAYIPKTQAAISAIALVAHTLTLIDRLGPQFYFVENPRGVLRKLPVMRGVPRHTVTYCQYGDTRMKPTDIWTNHPDPRFKPICRNGAPCHERAPRGAKTGTQGLKGARERGIIPPALCAHILAICEAEQGSWSEYRPHLRSTAFRRLL